MYGDVLECGLKVLDEVVPKDERQDWIDFADEMLCSSPALAALVAAHETWWRNLTARHRALTARGRLAAAPGTASAAPDRVGEAVDRTGGVPGRGGRIRPSLERENRRPRGAGFATSHSLLRPCRGAESSVGRSVPEVRCRPG
jgi:hypothetical protein